VGGFEGLFEDSNSYRKLLVKSSFEKLHSKPL
jgi:hypothetical protein